MRYLYLITFFLSLHISACKKPISNTCDNSSLILLENEDYAKETKPENYKDAYFIINEGGFTYGNASISAYFPNSNTIENEIFKNLNNYQLGDIAQSIESQNEYLYICVNNSQKIEIVNTNTFERLRTITGFSSPRYLKFINETDAIVSDLYTNSIQIVDTEKACLLAEIATKGWTEEIVKAGNDYWLIERNSIGAEEKFANLIALNLEDNTVKTRIEIPVEPNSLIQDNEGNIWILSSGFEDDNQLPQLIKFNTQTQSIEKSFSFSDYQNIAQNLSYNDSNNSLYFNRASDIFEMSITDSNLASSPIFISAAQIIYGLDINSNTNELFICDAVDYFSSGKVFIYQTNGNLNSEFTVGVLPNKVVF